MVPAADLDAEVDDLVVVVEHCGDDLGGGEVGVFFQAAALVEVYLEQFATGLGGEAVLEARLEGGGGLFAVAQAQGAEAQQLPLGGGLGVVGVLGLEVELLGLPQSVGLEVLVEHHEEVVEPALAQALGADAVGLERVGLLGGRGGGDLVLLLHDEELGAVAQQGLPAGLARDLGQEVVAGARVGLERGGRQVEQRGADGLVLVDDVAGVEARDLVEHHVHG